MDNVPRPIPNQRRRLHCRPIVRRRRRRRRRLCCRGRKVARKSSFVRSVGRSSPEAKVLTYFTTRLAVAAVCPSIPGRCPPTRPEAAIARWRGKFQVGSSQKSKCSIVFRVAMRLKLCLSPVHPMSSVDTTLDAPKNAIVEDKFGNPELKERGLTTLTPPMHPSMSSTLPSPTCPILYCCMLLLVNSLKRK